jgi:hypothetical protein
VRDSCLSRIARKSCCRAEPHSNKLFAIQRSASYGLAVGDPRSLNSSLLQSKGSTQPALWSYQHIRGELLDLLEVLAAKIQHVPVALSIHSDVPLKFTRNIRGWKF